MRRATSMMVDGTLYIVSGSVSWGARAFFGSFPGRNLLSGVNWMLDTSEKFLLPSLTSTDHSIFVDDNLNDHECLNRQQEKDNKSMMVDMSVQTDNAIVDSDDHLVTPKRHMIQSTPKCTPTRDSTFKENYTRGTLQIGTSSARRSSSPAVFYGIGKTPHSRYIRNVRSHSSDTSKRGTSVQTTPNLKMNCEVKYSKQVAKVRPLTARKSNQSPGLERNARVNLSPYSQRNARNNLPKQKTSTSNCHGTLQVKRPFCSRNKINIIRKNIEAASKRSSTPAPIVTQDRHRLHKNVQRVPIKSGMQKKAEVVSENENKSAVSKHQSVERSTESVKPHSIYSGMPYECNLSVDIDEPTYEDIDDVWSVGVQSDVIRPPNSEDLHVKENPSAFYQLTWNLGHETGDDDYAKFLGN